MCFGQSTSEPFVNLPGEFTLKLKEGHLLDKYDADYRLNPYYLRGDFDGDGRADYVVWARKKDTKASYMLIYLSSNNSTLESPYKSDRDPIGWEVISRQVVIKEWKFAKVPRIQGEAFWMYFGSGGMLFFVHDRTIDFVAVAD